MPVDEHLVDIATLVLYVGSAHVSRRVSHSRLAPQVVKTKDWAMQKLLEEGNVPLRDGVKELMDEALAADVQIGMLCGTVSQKASLLWMFCQGCCAG